MLDYLAANKSIFELDNCDEKRRMSAPMNTSATKLIIHKKGAENNEDEKRRIEFIQIHDTAHLVAANIIIAEEAWIKNVQTRVHYFLEKTWQFISAKKFVNYIVSTAAQNKMTTNTNLSTNLYNTMMLENED